MKATRSAEDAYQIAIIGAGLAGLTAARDLMLSGCESFLVLEARDRVGGRTYNHDLGHGLIAEAGGQWIGPGQTAIADLARELEIGTFDTYYQGETVFLADDVRIAQDLRGTIGADPTVASNLSRLACDVPNGAPCKAAQAAELDQLSLGDWLATQGLSAEDRISFEIGALLTAGAAPAKLGLLQYLSMINSAGSCGRHRCFRQAGVAARGSNTRRADSIWHLCSGSRREGSPSDSVSRARLGQDRSMVSLMHFPNSAGILDKMASVPPSRRRSADLVRHRNGRHLGRIDGRCGTLRSPGGAPCTQRIGARLRMAKGTGCTEMQPDDQTMTATDTALSQPGATETSGASQGDLCHRSTPVRPCIRELVLRGNFARVRIASILSETTNSDWSQGNG